MAVVVRRVGNSGPKVNGVVRYYTVASGHTISAGDFVEILENDEVINFRHVTNGIAASSGAGGSRIRVYTPFNKYTSELGIATLDNMMLG